ncbi:YdiU family protein [Anaerocolumna sedimenticola]|uniref:Protein nucleotidyltransferase YdiU n=1 Tax=Anaerocolumna sedimenticola TaxID=2696063 RepID=A0A6P1TRS9_9FIRM|nr:YdiU family protein [Anaerocolumna sedimenticola]QHQ63173.1 YdiU family protein [Anaerocolumna sedimenticola]
MTLKNETNPYGWNLDNSYAELPETFFSKLNPTPVQSPKLVFLNQSLAEELGLHADALQKDGGAAVFAGNKLPEGSEPLAQAYAGHQFGYFNMLGDGRALLLGEQITPKGNRVDIQLKGSGPTPYSRGGDGRAALGPMLREYIISEAMYALGIPTTRSLAVVTTGEAVIRETKLPGAVLTRVAASHIRVATFQYAAHWGTLKELKSLADYTIKRHFRENMNSPNPYLHLLKEVIKSQAVLIAKWQLVGFIHGVMNTDNMAISGETIDYGPCAFMDTYDPATVFSSIDTRGRYAYGNQPKIGEWNLCRFAETILPLLHEKEEEAVNMAQNAITEYMKLYTDNWFAGMRAKVGLITEEEQDKDLIQELLNLMKKYEADYSNTFLALTFGNYFGSPLFDSSEFSDWIKQWKVRLNRQNESEEAVRKLMSNSNPALIPRNHRVEEALKAAVDDGDFSVMERLLQVLSHPYAHTTKQAEYAKLPEKSACPYRTFCGT